MKAEIIKIFKNLGMENETGDSVVFFLVLDLRSHREL